MKWSSPATATALAPLLLLLSTVTPLASALDNGRALLPPLGWSSWNQYRTQVNETHVRDAAAALVSTGLAAKGWRTVVISDGWPGGRDATGRLFGNRERFPNGMKALCQHINSLGTRTSTSFSTSFWTVSHGFSSPAPPLTHRAACS